MHIAIIGAGNVGAALGKGWSRTGHAISFGVIDPADPSHRAAAAMAGGAAVGLVADVVGAAEVVVLAVPWGAVADVLRAGGSALDGKIVIDATNPLAVGDGGLALVLGFSTSGGEEVARLAPHADVFKTMNQVGYAVMPEATGYPAPPVMFVAGDNARKPIVCRLVEELGFEACDAGPLDRARLLEPYAMLWIEQAMLHGAGERRAFGLMQRTIP